MEKIIGLLKSLKIGALAGLAPIDCLKIPAQFPFTWTLVWKKFFIFNLQVHSRQHHEGCYKGLRYNRTERLQYRSLVCLKKCIFPMTLKSFKEKTLHIRGVLGNKCAGQHNLKTVDIREIMWK